jgi:predicted thioesterase
VTTVDGRLFKFTVRVAEGAREMGIGSHSRVVVDVAKFER